MARPSAWLLWLVGLTWAPWAMADYRVVVQEAHGGQYRSFHITPDGKYAWVVTGTNEHVLQVIDPGGPVVLRRFFLPERIQSAWVDTSSKKLVVSTRESIFLGHLLEEHLQEILPGTNGAVLLQEGGNLLAVLGQIPDSNKKEPGIFSYHDDRELGIYELKEKRWRFIRRTPIVIPTLESAIGLPHYHGLTALLFQDGALLAGGVGGSVGSMIPITFAVDVHLNLNTGKTRIVTGPSSRFGKPLDEKVIQFPAPSRPLATPEQDKDVELKNEPKYQAPEPLVKAMNHWEAVYKKAQPEKLLEKLKIGDNHVREATPMPFAVQEDRVQLAVRRFLRIPGAFGSHTAVLNLTKDGKIDIGPTRDTSNNPFGAGKRQFVRVESAEIDLNDLITGKPMVPAESLKTKGPKNLFFLEEGVLVHDGIHLAMYKPGEDKPLWSRQRISQKWEEIQLDDQRKTLALIYAGEPILAKVLRLADGEVISDIPRPQDMTDNYMSMALSRDGKRVAVVHAEELRIFEVASGKIVERHPTVGDRYLRNLTRWSGGWLLSGETQSNLFNDKTKKWQTVIPFARVVQLQEIETPQGKRLLLQNYSGQCCLANPVDGSVLARWVCADHNQYRAPLWNAVFANGKAMVRPTGWGPVLEIVDLRDLRVVLTIHHVPLGKNFGWIAFTPDGWWDASAGTERYVVVFHKGEAVQESRRNSDMIRQRLARVWK
jgi:hypothetical protein